jgi:hypothetical protein
MSKLSVALTVLSRDGQPGLAPAARLFADALPC